MMKHDEDSSNPSNNQTFEEILQTQMTRRGVLKGSLAVAAAGFLGGFGSTAFAAKGKGKAGMGAHGALIGFDPVPVAQGGDPSYWPRISADYEFKTLIPWGDPLEPGGPAYIQIMPNDANIGADFADLAARQTLQFGIGHDGMAYFPIERSRDDDRDDDDDRRGRGSRSRGNRHGLIAVNHEFGDNDHVIGVPQGTDPGSLDKVRRSQHAHGVGIAEIKEKGKSWQTVKSRYARRIHVNTPMQFSGPAAGHELLKTPNGNIPLGTVNNCANGVTPWGTYITCEENFNGYFGAKNAWSPTESQSRYGFSTGGFGYGWHLYDRRFDLSDGDYENEEHRFGWVVEIDPFDPTVAPAKRTALGRCKHEGAAFVEGRGGKVVVYMGDDQRFDYVYKFVSADNWKSMRARGMNPLDHGTLYVARFDAGDAEGDRMGTGEWLELSMNNPALAYRMSAGGEIEFKDQATILIHTRLAADLVGATPMDRPEWATVAPNGDVFITMTNNSRRQVVDEANPEAPNNDGHIIRMSDSAQHTGTTFEWDIFQIASELRGTESTFTDADGLASDPDGRLFVMTDGGQPDGLEDQLLVADSRSASGEAEFFRLLTGVTGDEVTGFTMTPDRRTLFVNLQHPGNGDPNATSFPVQGGVPDGVTVPRDATLVVTRKDGGIIGS
jgi:hypothetical protein